MLSFKRWFQMGGVKTWRRQYLWTPFVSHGHRRHVWTPFAKLISSIE